jgi:hypothetical protein
MMMVVGKKQVEESWHPKLMNQTQLKLRQANPIRATPTPTTTKLVSVADNLSTYSPKVSVPFYSQDTSFCFPSRTRLILRGRHDRRTMDVLLSNQITRVVIC